MVAITPDAAFNNNPSIFNYLPFLATVPMAASPQA